MKRSSAHASALGWIGGAFIIIGLLLLLNSLQAHNRSDLVVAGSSFVGASLLPIMLALVVGGIRSALVDHAKALQDGQYRVHLPKQQVAKLANEEGREGGDAAPS